jgi:hypothetical protein
MAVEEGTRLIDTMRRDSMGPAAEEAGAPWLAYVPSQMRLPADRTARSIVQVQWLAGPPLDGVALATYAHLLPGQLGQPLEPGLALRTTAGSTASRPVDLGLTAVQRTGRPAVVGCGIQSLLVGAVA